MSTPIREMMTEMPHTIGSKLNLNKAKDLMKKYSCHHLPVLDGGKLVGILSDQDLRVTDKELKELKIEDLMTEDPITVEPSKDVFQVAMLMHEKKIGSVIISASPYSPWGIFTSTDAVKYLSSAQKNNKETKTQLDPSKVSSFE